MNRTAQKNDFVCCFLTSYCYISPYSLSLILHDDYSEKISQKSYLSLSLFKDFFTCFITMIELGVVTHTMHNLVHSVGKLKNFFQYNLVFSLFYSARKAIAASFFAAIRAGICPPSIVKMVLTTIKIIA